MTIYVGSRYEFEVVDRVLHRDGQHHAAVFRELGSVFGGFNFQTHIIMEGDRLDTIAAARYGDSNMWWLICEANPELFDFDTLTPGSALRIPYGPG